MAQFLGKDAITPFDSMQLQRVPLIIHVPGQEGKVISKVSGQIDIKPTLLHLLGIKTNKSVEFGTDLFIKEEDPLMVMRDGSFVSEDYVYTKTCAINETQVKKQTSHYVNRILKKQNRIETFRQTHLWRFVTFRS